MRNKKNRKLWVESRETAEDLWGADFFCIGKREEFVVGQRELASSVEMGRDHAISNPASVPALELKRSAAMLARWSVER